MKNKITISFLLFLFISGICYGQDTIPQLIPVQEEVGEEVVSVQDTLSLPLDSLGLKQDSIFQRKLATYSPPATSIDTTQRINYWRIMERTGEIVTVRPDTFLTDYFNRTNVEGMGISIAYLGNLGLPLESRIFFEREDRSDFLFSDNLRPYFKQPGTFNFINTKIPHSNISYQSAGSNTNKEERFQALLTLNLGKKLNVGTSVDYLYARGYYNSQGAKHTDWVFFSNYLSERHQVHLFINPAMAYTNGENGGLQDDNYISHPDWVSSLNMRTKNIPTQFGNTWNRTSGNRLFLNYRYNLGFERETQQTDSLGETVKEFIPVSSVIYTFDYTDRKRHFDTQDSVNVNRFYNYDGYLIPGILRAIPINSASYRSIKNTFGLSLREGFSQWAKFDLTAYITHDFRQFWQMDLKKEPMPYYTFGTINQNATFIGGELADRSGKILRYNAQGSLGVIGYNLGDFNLSGTVETRIPFLNDTASVSATGFIKSIEPTFYEKKYYSQYIWWNNNFSKIRKVRIGGKIVIPHTQTEGGFGVENITNYIYFGSNGKPEQTGENIQVLAVNLQQNFKLGVLHWDNQAVYQTSSNQTILPLPAFSAYSSLYLQFAIAKVLTIQMGANAHYWTSYYSPTYEPAIQQFKLQPEETKVKTGEYPLIGGFFNCHLKQTRFFLEYYNLSALLISPPEYFSIPHYPVKPPVLRLGLSIDFIN